MVAIPADSFIAGTDSFPVRIHADEPGLWPNQTRSQREEYAVQRQRRDAARTSTSTSWGSSPGRQVHVVCPLLAAACYTLPSSMAIKSLGICNWQGARHGQMETGQCSFIRSYMGWNSFAFIFFSAFFFLPRLRSSTTCQWARALGRRRPGVRAECLGQRAMHIRWSIREIMLVVSLINVRNAFPFMPIGCQAQIFYLYLYMSVISDFWLENTSTKSHISNDSIVAESLVRAGDLCS